MINLVNNIKRSFTQLYNQLPSLKSKEGRSLTLMAISAAAIVASPALALKNRAVPAAAPAFAGVHNFALGFFSYNN